MSDSVFDISFHLPVLATRKGLRHVKKVAIFPSLLFLYNSIYTLVDSCAFNRHHPFQLGKRCPFLQPDSAQVTLISAIYSKDRTATVHGRYMSTKD